MEDGGGGLTVATRMATPTKQDWECAVSDILRKDRIDMHAPGVGDLEILGRCEGKSWEPCSTACSEIHVATMIPGILRRHSTYWNGNYHDKRLG